MSPKKEGAPAPAKKGKSKVELINERFLKFREYAREVHKLLVASASIAPDEIKAKLTTAAEHANATVNASFEASESLLALHKAKWSPKISGHDVFIAGSLAMVKPHHLEFYTQEGAFDKADLLSLRVVSVHGKLAKVEIFRDGLKGETVGVIPCFRLQARKE
jgi:hypothetical protein